MADASCFSLKKTPVSFVIRNQLTGRLIKAHANDLRFANLEWKIPKMDGKQPRKSTLAAIPPEDSESEIEGDENENSEDSDDTIIYDPTTYINDEHKESKDKRIRHESEEIDRTRQKYKLENSERKILDNSDDSEDGIPTFELEKRIQAKQRRDVDQTLSDDYEMNDEDCSTDEEEMHVNNIDKKRK